MSLDASNWHSAGALLRAAREKQGLHIGALAAAIKVTPRKLEALEADRYEELSGAIFTRALAQSVCRVLRIDAKPVLAMLPRPDSQVLENVTGGLNAPFRDKGGRDDRSMSAVAQRVLVGAALALAVAAVVLSFVPLSSWKSLASSAPAPAAATGPSTTAGAPGVPLFPPGAPPDVATPGTTTSTVERAAAPAPAMGASAAPAGASGAVPAVTMQATGTAASTLAPTPTPSTGPSLAAAPAPAPLAPSSSVVAVLPGGSGPLQIQADRASWVEVRERGGRVLLSRMLAAQETVALDGSFPLSVTVGNVAATRLTLRGKPVELNATRGNVARLELP